MAVNCTYKWTPLPHDCTADEVADCRRKCQKRRVPFCGCVVVLEVEYDCAGWEGELYYAFGGKIDFTTCLCKTRRPTKAQRRARRRTFNRDKKQLIKDWEQEHDLPWPTDPATGFKADAHHLDPIQYGGGNTVDNLVPLLPADHRKVHDLYRKLRKNC